jgi:chromatin remodeling complex protein RSC6
MKRSSSSSSKSVATAPKSVETVKAVPASVEKDLKEPVQKQTPAPATKRPRKEKAVVKEEPVDASEGPSAQKSSSSVPLVLETEPQTVQVGGDQLDAELANIPADDFEVRCVEFFNALRDLVNKVSDIKSEYKAIERIWTKRFKLVSKSSGKKKKKTTTRAPSGFVKPTPISDELATFLGRDKGTEMARTEVTREINVYIRTNGLQDPTNGRRINANPALSSLLKLSEGDELTYFNLQKYMSGHFPKAVSQPVPV